MTSLSTDRRTFLKSAALAGGGLAVGLALPVRGAADTAAQPFKPNAFIRITPDDRIVLVVSMAEMGQGVRTALPQILAEELDADWRRVTIEQAPVDPVYNHPLYHVQATGGSSSVRAFYMPLREAGAAARMMLVDAAAAQWGVPSASCHTAAGEVIGPNGERLSYGALSTAASTRLVPKTVTLKSPADFRLIGQSIGRTDTRAKVTGTAGFGLDVRYDGLLTAVLLHPPALGATLVSFDATPAKAIKGVRDVVAVSGGLAVVADTFWAAKRGREALIAKWDASSATGISSASIRADMVALLAGPAKVARHDGDVDKAVAAQHVEALYEAPYLAHACMEPMNCTAHVTSDQVEIHAPTQSAGVNRAMVAGLLKIKPERVSVTTTFLGGGFGRRFCPDFVLAAVETSKAVGAPVKVVYTREDDMKGQYYRPASVTHLSASLDATGAPVAFAARAVCASISRASGMGPAEGLDHAAVEGLASWPYSTPNVTVDWVEHRGGPGVWFWRSVGSSQNEFFSESFIDELAHAAGQDPFEYRRGLLSHEPRLRRVLELAAEKAGWGTPLPQGRARGIAVAKSFDSYVAEVVEISLNDDGTPKVHRVVAAVDCGTVVNPGIVQRQVQSAVMYGLSAALFGEITLEGGRIQQQNFDGYPVVRMSEAPPVEVHVVASTEPPTGIGEPGTPPLAPALANAYFALTGKRVRKLPFAAALRSA
jgi:isoquinoline 1-oxidoreductase subunit beta